MIRETFGDQPFSQAGEIRCVLIARLRPKVSLFTVQMEHHDGREPDMVAMGRGPATRKAGNGYRRGLGHPTRLTKNQHFADYIYKLLIFVPAQNGEIVNFPAWTTRTIPRHCATELQGASLAGWTQNRPSGGARPLSSHWVRF